MTHLTPIKAVLHNGEDRHADVDEDFPFGDLMAYLSTRRYGDNVDWSAYFGHVDGQPVRTRDINYVVYGAEVDR